MIICLHMWLSLSVYRVQGVEFPDEIPHAPLTSHQSPVPVSNVDHIHKTPKQALFD